MNTFKHILVFCLLVFANCLAAQNTLDKDRKWTFSLGAGYMNEWKNEEGHDPFTGVDLDDYFTPNNAFIVWGSFSRKIYRDYFFRFGYGQEKTTDDDVEQSFWLRSLDFSLGKVNEYNRFSTSLFIGISSIKLIANLYSMTVDRFGNVIYIDITHSHNDLAFLHPHLGGDVSLKLNKGIYLGVRAKVMSDFSTFGRYDISLSTTFKF